MKKKLREAEKHFSFDFFIDFDYDCNFARIDNSMFLNSKLSK
jgi:hypothetical protein